MTLVQTERRTDSRDTHKELSACLIKTFLCYRYRYLFRSYSPATGEERVYWSSGERQGITLVWGVLKDVNILILEQQRWIKTTL